MKLIIPIILLITSIAISVFYTNENYNQIKAVQDKNNELTQALEKSREVVAKREALKKQFNEFKPIDLERIAKAVPDSVDNIQLLLDIQGIADEKNMKISNTKIEEEKVSKEEGKAVQKGGLSYGSISLSFNTKASYNTFLEFLHSIEESLRIVDITSLSFRSTEDGIYDYAITIKTYWLKK